MIQVDDIKPGIWWVKCRPRFSGKDYWELIRVRLVQPGWITHDVFGTNDNYIDDIIEIGFEINYPDEVKNDTE